jgi:hypothetical protein
MRQSRLCSAKRECFSCAHTKAHDACQADGQRKPSVTRFDDYMADVPYINCAAYVVSVVRGRDMRQLTCNTEESPRSSNCRVATS